MEAAFSMRFSHIPQLPYTLNLVVMPVFASF